MTEEELNKLIEEDHRKTRLKNIKQSEHRAQAVTIGKCGANSTEITLRGIDGNYLFAIYHPAEVVELIHQLAANIGCHIHIQPRSDFASYREWRAVTEEEQEHLNGWAPFPMETNNAARIGSGPLSLDRPFRFQNDSVHNIRQLEQKLLAQQKQISAFLTKAEEKENAVATKKAVNKRSPKRSRTTTK